VKGVGSLQNVAQAGGANRCEVFDSDPTTIGGALIAPFLQAESAFNREGEEVGMGGLE